jgi:hypothetical protein
MYNAIYKYDTAGHGSGGYVGVLARDAADRTNLTSMLLTNPLLSGASGGYGGVLA